MTITIISTPQLSPIVAPNQRWELVGSDGDRVVALRSTSGTADRLATFNKAAPWSWSERSIPGNLSLNEMIVSGNTLVSYTYNYTFYSTDAGSSWSGAVIIGGGGALVSLFLRGTTVIALFTTGEIFTAGLHDLSSWSSAGSDLSGDMLLNTGAMSFFNGMYYLVGARYVDSGWRMRIYRSANLGSWSLVYSDTESAGVVGTIVTDTKIIMPRDNGTALVSSNGTAWSANEVDWLGSPRYGVTTPDNLAVTAAGSYFRVSADGAEWEILYPDFPVSGRMVLFDGGVISGRMLYGSRQMGAAGFYYSPPGPDPELPPEFWMQLRNSEESP